MTTLARPAAVDAAKTLMFAEAAEGGDAVARFLDHNRAAIARLGAYLRQHPPRSVTTCARGSSDHAATFGKYLIETLSGVPVSSAALSTSSIYAAPVVAAESLCIAISQSGRSPDLLTAVEAHKRAGAYVVALVNDEDSPLAALADELLALKAGPEKSVAATKSYIVSLAGLAAIAAAWAGDDRLEDALTGLPEQLRAAFALDWSAALPALKDATNLFVIGRATASRWRRKRRSSSRKPAPCTPKPSRRRKCATARWPSSMTASRSWPWPLRMRPVTVSATWRSNSPSVARTSCWPTPKPSPAPSPCRCWPAIPRWSRS